MASEASKLKRTLRFGDLMGIAVGQIIGAGIMSSTGIAIGMTGTGVVLAYAVSPFLTLICLYPLVMLGSALPAAGGQYRYASRMLGKDAGVFYMILYIFMECFISVYALSFASYFCSLVPGANERLVAIGILTVLFLTNLIGTKAAANLNRVTTVILVSGLLLFAGFGLAKTDLSYVFDSQNLFNHGPAAFISTLALLYTATVGAQCVVDLGAETINPQKNIPRVIIISTLSVGVLYVFVSLAAAGVLPIEQTENQTLAVTAAATMPKLFYYLFMIGAALGATASAINSTFSWVSKPMLVACEDGIFPKKMATVSKNGVPWKCLLFFYLINVIPVICGLDIATMQKFVTANSLLTKLFIAAALIRFAKKYPEKIKASSLPISPKNCILFARLSMAVLLILSISLLLNLSVYAAVFVVGAFVVSLIYSRTVVRKVEIPDDLVEPEK